MLDSEDGAAIKRVQQLLTKSQLKTKWYFLSLVIEKLKKQGLPLSESIAIIPQSEDEI